MDVEPSVNIDQLADGTRKPINPSSPLGKIIEVSTPVQQVRVRWGCGALRLILAMLMTVPAIIGCLCGGGLVVCTSRENGMAPGQLPTCPVGFTRRRPLEN